LRAFAFAAALGRKNDKQRERVREWDEGCLLHENTEVTL